MLEDLERENTETRQKFHGPTIVAGERLQEKIDESLTCRFCQGSIELVENLRTWFHLDVPVAERKLAAARTEILAIWGCHATVSKVFSFLGLYGWNDSSDDLYPT